MAWHASHGMNGMAFITMGELDVHAWSLPCLLVFWQRVYILGPRTNLKLENCHGESQEEGQEKGR
jgi:hypothetical protein